MMYGGKMFQSFHFLKYILIMHVQTQYKPKLLPRPPTTHQMAVWLHNASPSEGVVCFIHPTGEWPPISQGQGL